MRIFGGCTWAQNNGDNRSTVAGCEFDSESGGMKIEGDNTGPIIEVTENNFDIDDYGIHIEDLTATDDGGRYRDYPVVIHKNEITGWLHNGSGGIIIEDTIPYNSLLIARNYIHHISFRGIFVDSPGAEPHIFNNAIWHCGQEGLRATSIPDDDEDPYNGIRISQNVAYACAVGFWLDFDNNDPNVSMNDVDFTNNIMFGNEWGLWVDIDLDEDDVDYNAFAGNQHDGNSSHVRDVNGINNDLLNDLTCVIEGEAGEWVELVDMFPDFNNWDFHILIDDIQGNPPDYDYNMDLVDSGDPKNDTWFDPTFAIFGDQQLIHNDPDMGIYGGPFVYWYKPLNPGFFSEDYILVTDPKSYYADLPVEYYVFRFPLEETTVYIPANECKFIRAGSVHDYGPHDIYVSGQLKVDGGADSLKVGLIFDGGCIRFNDTTDVDESYINYAEISGATYGVYLNGVDDTSGDRLEIDHCLFDSCGVGVYANNSRLSMTDCSITNSNSGSWFGAGVYLNNCSSGKVVIDGCDITDNGTGSTYNSAGIYLYSSDPEIINTTIEDNSGCGIACVGSSPDLNTYSSSGNQPNQIASNGGTLQTGSDGAEIFLKNYSSPSIKYNNIFDRTETPFAQNGYCIYIDNYNYSNVYAYDNYWGTQYASTYESQLFYQPTGYYAYYSPWTSSAYTIAGAEEDFDCAISYWEAGEFEAAAAIFRETVYEPGSIGISSVHYLLGCTGEMENGNFATLRSFLQDVADEHEDDNVAHVANRFATHCYTEMGNYENAMAEYDDARVDAECVRDSVYAVIDYLLVDELANGGAEVDCHGLGIQQQISELIQYLDEADEAELNSALLPTELKITSAYPNPFNSTVTVNFQLPKTGFTDVSVYDCAGRMVESLLSSNITAGSHKVVWNGLNEPTGIYFLKVNANNNQVTQKVTLIK